jgi:hypothetical protein
MSDDFPIQIKQFMSENIRSVADLEAVLLLRKHCDRTWTAAEVSRALATSHEMAARQLAGLSERNLLTRTTGTCGESFQYRSTSDLDAKTDLLATLYRERRVSVITAIYSQPGGDVRTFADSFKLRKDH